MHSLEPLTAGVGPYDALRRTAFLLERSRQHSRRVEAFRGAAKVVAEQGEDAIAERVEAFRGAAKVVAEQGEDAIAGRVADGTLTDLPGIGRSTAGVIEQAVAGELPAYLARQQEDEGGPLTDLDDGAAALVEAVVGDCHTHSDWSDGGSPIEEMVLTAVELGQEWMVLTDHSPRLRIANGLSVERLQKQLRLVERIDGALGDSFRLLKGIEVDILDDGGLDQTDEMLAQLDLVTASVHSKLRAPKGAMTQRMLGAVRNPRVDVLGHCTGRLVTGGRGTRPQSEFDARAVFEACAEHGVAVEINSRPERCDPPDELIELARDLGCLFAIDSDAHAPGQLEMKVYGCERAHRLGIDADRIVTTWDAERLLEWSRSRRS